jgi:hypothetical protein
MPTETQPLLEEEARAYRDLAPEDYDRAISTMLDAAAAPPRSNERTVAFLDLAGATLRRHGPLLARSRGHCAEHLLALRSETAEPGLRWRIDLLFFKAWLELGATVLRGPASMLSRAPLPFGVQPWDVANLTDPALLEEARRLEELYDEEVERSNGRGLALDAMRLLVALLDLELHDAATEDQRKPTRALAAQMAGALGVPDRERKWLEELAGASDPTV